MGDQLTRTFTQTLAFRRKAAAQHPALDCVACLSADLSLRLFLSPGEPERGFGCACELLYRAGRQPDVLSFLICYHHVRASKREQG